MAVATMLLLAAACGDEGSSAAATTSTTSTMLPPETTQVTATSTTAPAVVATTVVRPTTTRPAPVTTRVPATTPKPPPPVPGGGTVALGETFTIEVGQSVSVAGAGLTVTFAAVVSDNRCPPGVMCIQAGNGVISVTVAKAGMAPANLTLNTTEGPASGRYATNTVELVQLFRGPVARLQVT